MFLLEGSISLMLVTSIRCMIYEPVMPCYKPSMHAHILMVEHELSDGAHYNGHMSTGFAYTYQLVSDSVARRLLHPTLLCSKGVLS
jgi:hypothetical protein